MNKKSGWWLISAVVAGALVMQGCAQTGGVRTAAGSTAATTKIPEYKGKPVIAADTKDHFDAIAAAVRQQMKSGGGSPRRWIPGSRRLMRHSPIWGRCLPSTAAWPR